MKEKEQLILQLIRQNPFIAQNELAERLGLSRSAVAGYISSLMKQGKIIGRAYVLSEPSRIVCIGGANVDRKAQADTAIQFGASNPVTVTQTRGGVARNIAETLGRLGQPVSLITVVGDDQEGEWLLSTTRAYVDISQAAKLDGTNTGTYTAVLDGGGEMVVALADMAIYDALSPDFLQKRWSHISSAAAVLLDTNFPSEVLSFVIERCREERIPLCVVPVSAPKVKKLPKDLRGVTWLIANEEEAFVLAGRTGTIEAALDDILSLGVENIIVTRGAQGIIYKNKHTHGVLSAPKINIVDVTGAGDAFVAGFLYGINRGESFVRACEFGMSSSIIALQTSETVCSRVTEQVIKETHQHYFS